MSTYFNRCRSSFTRPSLGLSRGFTLIELMVVVAVITIITAFLLFNQNKFNSSTIMRSLAYSVGLSIRQAQLYGVSVRGFGTGATPSFGNGYGVYFSNPNTFTLFADINNNSAYDAGEGLSGVGGILVSVGRGFTIGKFCAVSSGGQQDCYPSGGTGVLSDMTVYFKRPNPDAAISATCTGSCASSYTSAYIQLTSLGGGGDTRSVKVTNTGQISVCPLNTNPPAC